MNGINSLGSIMLFAGGNVTINGPVKLNSDTSFSIADYAGTGNTVGAKRDFYINSLIADGAGAPTAFIFSASTVVRAHGAPRAARAR